MATLPSMAQASTVLGLEIPEVVSEESLAAKIAGLCVEPAGSFEIPPEIKATMSKEEIYKLQAIPGYFKPQQMSVPGGQQMLLTNPQPVKAVVCVDEEMRAVLADRLWLPYESVSWEQVYAWAGNILEGGDDYLEIPFGIDIQITISTYWYTPNNLDIRGLLDLISGVDPRGVGCDIIVLMTGQPGFFEPDGLAWGLGGPMGATFRNEVLCGLTSKPLPA